MAFLPVSILIVLIAVSFGRRVIRLMKAETHSALERSLFGAAIGMGTLSYAVLAAGLLGRLYAGVFTVIIVLMLLLSLNEFVSSVKDSVKGIKSVFGKRPGIISAVTGLLGLMALIAALAPPSGMDWDGLAYHLALPKQYLTSHSIYYVTYNPHSNFPFLQEMLYIVGLSFGSPVLAKLFHFFMFAATSAAVFAICSRYVNVRTGGIAALIFMSAPIVFWEAGVAYVELATAFYITMSLYALLNWRETGSKNWLVICGIMGGLALGTKVLSGAVIFMFCVWILISTLKKEGVGKAVAIAFITGLIALIVGSPWYVKSYIYTGNPVYPFLYNVFGGANWSPIDAKNYSAELLSYGMGRGFFDFIMYPWNMTVNGYEFSSNKGIHMLIGPAFLGLIPVQLLWGRRSVTVGAIGLICAAFFVVSFVNMQYSRYLIMILPMLSIYAASGVDSMGERGWKFARNSINVFLGFCAAITLIVGAYLACSCIGAAVGTEAKEDYLMRTLEVYPAEKWINKNVPESSGVVLFDEVRGFYIDRRYIWGNPGHNQLIPWSELKTGEEFVDCLKGIDGGYSYALVNKNIASSGSEHTKLIEDALETGHASIEFASKGFVVYKFE